MVRLLNVATMVASACAGNTKGVSCQASAFAKLPYCDASLSPEDRVADLLPRMKMDDKLGLLHGGSALPETSSKKVYTGETSSNSNLGIPPNRLHDGPQGFRMRNHSVGVQGTSTQWPSALAVASTWDDDAVQSWGEAMGREFSDKGATMQLGPGMCFHRVPQDGRNFEYMTGEDPFFGARMAGAAVRGIQSQGVMANAKHWIACDQDTMRSGMSSNVDERTTMEIYAPAFQGAVDADVASVMCSYNYVNGVHSCENDQSLNVELKGYLGFEGFVLSDWGATHSTEESAQGGLDMEMPDSKWFGDKLTKSVKAGDVSEKQIDEKVSRILKQMFKYGLFEKISSAYDEDEAAAVQERMVSNVTSAKHNKLARSLAAAGTVLLENKKETLPLDAKDLKSIAIFGAAADGIPVSSACAEGDDAPPCVPMDTHEDVYPRGVLTQGGGSGGVGAPYVVTPAEGIRSRAGKAVDVKWHDVEADKAAAPAADADVAVVVVGTVSGEGRDRESLSLSKGDNELIEAVAAANKRTVAVIMAPGAMILPWSSDVGALAVMFMGGQEVGNAVADVLFGDVNPSGRLPISFPNKENETITTVEQWPGVEDDDGVLQSNFSEKLEVGYRWYNAHDVKPAYSYGHGLSYTTFEYSDITVDGRAVSFVVKNDGKLDGAEVPQLYLDFPESAEEPPRQLKGFKKILLEAGKKETVTFELSDRDLSIWDVDHHKWSLVHGKYSIYVGASSADIRLTAAANLAAPERFEIV